MACQCYHCLPDLTIAPTAQRNCPMEFESLQVTRFEQNCSILRCGLTNKAAVIDPGGDLHVIRDYLDLMELELDVVLITHGHLDHAGGAAELASLSGARIEGPHRGDEALLDGLAQSGQRYGVRAGNVRPDRWLQDGDQVRFGEVVIDVLHCPGHTNGHVAYFSRTHRQAFVGDILFRGTIGAWQHPDGNLAKLVDSIRSKLFPLGNDVRFVPGHGETSTFGQERQANPFVSDAAYERWRASKARGVP
jgi:hydroxyacylglutathione hydrolase